MESFANYFSSSYSISSFDRNNRIDVLRLHNNDNISYISSSISSYLYSYLCLICLQVKCISIDVVNSINNIIMSDDIAKVALFLFDDDFMVSFVHFSAKLDLSSIVTIPLYYFMTTTICFLLKSLRLQSPQQVLMESVLNHSLLNPLRTDYSTGE